MSSDTKETFYALLMLFCFAVVAAGYVWKEGMGKGKSVHDLVVRSVVIVTSVVPRGLPMQVGCLNGWVGENGSDHFWSRD